MLSGCDGKGVSDISTQGGLWGEEGKWVSPCPPLSQPCKESLWLHLLFCIRENVAEKCDLSGHPWPGGCSILSFKE